MDAAPAHHSPHHAASARCADAICCLLLFLPSALQVRQYKTYVAREILHHASLRHPFIISLNEVVLTPRVSKLGRRSVDLLMAHAAADCEERKVWSRHALPAVMPAAAASACTSTLSAEAVPLFETTLATHIMHCVFHSMPQSLAIVMEYAAGGDMFSHLRDRRCAYMQQRSMHMRCCCCIPAFKHAVQLGPAPLAHCMLLACQLSQRLSTSAPLHPPASAPASTAAPAGRARGL